MKQLFYSLLYMLNEMSPYILLGFLIAGLMYAFVSQKQMARHFSGSGWKSVVKATLFGIPLPLCSCGVLPTAIGMRRSGASRASSTAFLIATPQTGVDSIAATWSLLGPAFAVIRPVAALTTALFGGLLAGKSEPAGECVMNQNLVAESHGKSFGAKCVDALRYGFVELVASIGKWLIIGLVIAAIITVFVPTDFFAGLSDRPVVAMLAVLIIAVPMYVCATGSIPIALSLILKGLSPGTAFVLLMAGPAVNFASVTLISSEMGKKAASVYIGSIIVGAVAFGLLIDYLLPSEWFAVKAVDMHACHGNNAAFPLFPTICSVILVG
ncbi:MAG: permease [Paramuribaculum sp.]|nr:permease [Paramuribaculum sp.]